MNGFPDNGPAIITCALTGGIHGKEASPNLPEPPDEIVEPGDCPPARKGRPPRERRGTGTCG